MVWKEVEPMEEKIRFVLKATREEVSFFDLCWEFGISRKTGYKWLNRYLKYGLQGLHDVSRRPLISPRRISSEIEERVIRERCRHNRWGPKKLYQRLVDKGLKLVPSESTIGNILKRN